MSLAFFFVLFSPFFVSYQISIATIRQRKFVVPVKNIAEIKANKRPGFSSLRKYAAASGGGNGPGSELDDLIKRYITRREKAKKKKKRRSPLPAGPDMLSSSERSSRL